MSGAQLELKVRVMTRDASFENNVPAAAFIKVRLVVRQVKVDLEAIN